MENQCCCYDFTLKEEGVVLDELKEYLGKLCKKWCFQLEEGKSGYVHYQGRVSLKVKLRLLSLCNKTKDWGFHWSVTSNDSVDNDFYVTKEDTRRGGPWCDKDIKIPRQVREIVELYPWQKYIVDHSKDWDTRTINVVIDSIGCNGKSILTAYMCTKGLARKVPALNNFKDVMGMVLCMPESRCYLVDMPRAQNKENIEEFYSAIESLKDGHVWDCRYSYKERWMDCPNVWVFSNRMPDRSLLSADRWKFWKIRKECLEEF